MTSYKFWKIYRIVELFIMNFGRLRIKENILWAISSNQPFFFPLPFLLLSLSPRDSLSSPSATARHHLFRRLPILQTTWDLKPSIPETSWYPRLIKKTLNKRETKERSSDRSDMIFWFRPRRRMKLISMFSSRRGKLFCGVGLSNRQVRRENRKEKEGEERERQRGGDGMAVNPEAMRDKTVIFRIMAEL